MFDVWPAFYTLYKFNFFILRFYLKLGSTFIDLKYKDLKHREIKIKWDRSYTFYRSYWTERKEKENTY